MAKNNKYTDLDLNFLAHPLNGDVSKRVDVEAVKKSVQNLVLTNKYERHFHPELSSGVRGLLFENVTPVTAQLIGNRIRDVITAYEPRVDLIDVAVDPAMDRNHYGVTILFRLKNSQTDIDMSMVLQRIR